MYAHVPGILLKIEKKETDTTTNKTQNNQQQNNKQKSKDVLCCSKHFRRSQTLRQKLVPGIFKIPGTMGSLTTTNQILTNLNASGILKIPETREIESWKRKPKRARSFRKLEMPA